MLGCETGPFPSVFKEGWLRLNKKVPFLSGADGVVCKRSRSLLIDTRSAPYFCWDLLTTPSAPLRNGIFLLMAQPPSLKTEGNGSVSQPTPLPTHRVVTCGTVLITDQFSIFIRLLATSFFGKLRNDCSVSSA